MNGLMLFVVPALWLTLVGLFLADKYLLKTQATPRMGKYSVVFHRVFDVVAIALMLGGTYLLLLNGTAWVMVAFSIGLLWPGLPIAVNYVVGHQVFDDYWDEVATENNFVLDAQIWLSVIISLVITLLVMSWTYYS
jgi:Na+/H+-translocating membrane pyrophosphatase